MTFYKSNPRGIITNTCVLYVSTKQSAWANGFELGRYLFLYSTLLTVVEVLIYVYKPHLLFSVISSVSSKRHIDQHTRKENNSLNVTVLLPCNFMLTRLSAKCLKIHLEMEWMDL